MREIKALPGAFLRAANDSFGRNAVYAELLEISQISAENDETMMSCRCGDEHISELRIVTVSDHSALQTSCVKGDHKIDWKNTFPV